ncbi:MAG TPA: pilus assembly protein PilP [Rhodocyclaceae bacterium]|nr:pilus assembly protein PilP [Rhodocyclaceae bacterium]
MKPYWFIIAACLCLTACGGDEHQDLKDWMAKESVGLRGRVPPLPQLKTFPVVDYDNGDLPSPFDPVKLEPDKHAGGGANRPDTNRRREPLEAFPLESLKMVGMMLMDGKPVALIQADKTIYQGRVGNYLGQNFGVITKITDSDLTLKELIEDANGDWVERVSSMQLQEQEDKK